MFLLICSSRSLRKSSTVFRVMSLSISIYEAWSAADTSSLTSVRLISPSSFLVNVPQALSLNLIFCDFPNSSFGANTYFNLLSGSSNIVFICAVVIVLEAVLKFSIVLLTLDLSVKVLVPSAANFAMLSAICVSISATVALEFFLSILSLICDIGVPLLIASSISVILFVVSVVFVTAAGVVVVVLPPVVPLSALFPVAHSSNHLATCESSCIPCTFLSSAPVLILLNLLAHTSHTSIPSPVWTGTGINGIDHTVLVAQSPIFLTPTTSHKSLENDSAAISIIHTTQIPNRLTNIHPI